MGVARRNITDPIARIGTRFNDFVLVCLCHTPARSHLNSTEHRIYDKTLVKAA